MQGRNSLQPKRNVEEMQYLISEQAAGELTVKQFCEEHQLSEAVFYYWQKKLKGEKPRSLSSGGFREIAVTGGNEAYGGQLFAEYKGIRFYQEPSVSLLKQLIG
jgi:hypothetical protein